MVGTFSEDGTVCPLPAPDPKTSHLGGSKGTAFGPGTGVLALPRPGGIGTHLRPVTASALLGTPPELAELAVVAASVRT